VGKLRKNQELQGKVKKIIRSGAIVELLDHGEEEGFIRSSSIAVGGDENVSAETLLLHVGQEVVASEELSIQKSALPEEQASPEIQEAPAEYQVKDVISEQPPLASDLVGATTEGSIINKNGDVGVLNPFELDSSMPTKLIGYTTQVASAAIEKLSKLVEEQASAELVEETEFQGEDVVPVQQTILGDFVEATAGIGIVPEEPRAKLSDTNKEFFNPAEDAMGAELVEAEEEGIEKVACEESANGKFVLPEEQASPELEEGTEDKAQDVIPEQQPVANLMEATAEGIDAVSEDKLEATLAPDEESRAESWIDKNKELLDAGKDEIGAALVDAAEEIENQVAFEKSFSMEKLGLSEEQASMEFAEEETQDKAQDALLDQQLVPCGSNTRD
ncbi:unnamed protein product, partial [Sphagnum jensenii]